jgi:hypothetical protein
VEIVDSLRRIIEEGGEEAFQVVAPIDSANPMELLKSISCISEASPWPPEVTDFRFIGFDYRFLYL